MEKNVAINAIHTIALHIMFITKQSYFNCVPTITLEFCINIHFYTNVILNQLFWLSKESCNSINAFRILPNLFKSILL